MIFLLSTRKEVMGTYHNIMARLEFINDITGVEPTLWKITKLGPYKMTFLVCKTNAGINGIYITAHNREVEYLSLCNFISKIDFVIANTCVYEKDFDTNIMYNLRKVNKNIAMYYAKQEVEITTDRVFRKTNTIKDVGNFGFMTSISDRLMFINRKKGFMDALNVSFNKISGVYGVNYI